MCRPFRALQKACPCFPGRCPGLICLTPSAYKPAVRDSCPVEGHQDSTSATRHRKTQRGLRPQPRRRQSTLTQRREGRKESQRGRECHRSTVKNCVLHVGFPLRFFAVLASLRPCVWSSSASRKSSQEKRIPNVCCAKSAKNRQEREIDRKRPVTIAFPLR